jgi:LmbE family N-acetylglucosaminyl deacetylase
VSLTFESDPGRILCLGAHADDIEIGAGGTILTLADRFPGASFTFVVFSAPWERRTEAIESAAAMLGDRVTISIGEFEDGYLPYRDPASVKDFLKLATGDLNPDLVLAPSPSDLHQDHRFVADLAGQVFRGPLILGYEIVKFDGDLGAPNVFQPLEARHVEAKLDHLRTHFASQQGKPWYGDGAFSALMRIRGIECKAVSGNAEAFYGSKVVLQ